MRVLMLGATGNLGRPVARALCARGHAVRALVRSPARAAAKLPQSCELAPGDLRDQRALRAALRGADAVYTSLAPPYSPQAAYDPERDGTSALIEAMRHAGVRRVVRLSAREVSAPARWWVLARKRDTDAQLLDSGLDVTLMRPTWFMESIPCFMVGRLLAMPRAPHFAPSWLAAADYAQQVARALESSASIGRTYYCAGPERVDLATAARRFQQSYARRIVRVGVPQALIRAAGVVLPMARYLSDLLAIQGELDGEPDYAATERELGEATMRLEDYARSIAVTRDLPTKL